MKYVAPSLVTLSLAALLSLSPAVRPDDEKDSPSKGEASHLGPNASLDGQIPFPPDNTWNRDISDDPVDPNSNRIIHSIGWSTSLHPDFGDYIGKPYVVVPGTQRKVRVSFSYADQSDRGPYPIPPNAPVEEGNDRHVMVVDRDNWKLYELYDAHRGGDGWHAVSGAIFNLNSNELRPARWTSADAAGLPLFPGLVRFDEVCQGKEIRHALRFTVSRTRKGFVAPARHYASSSRDSSLPPMGCRVRLRADYDTSHFPPCVQVILRAMKTYGMFVADHGSSWYISGAPDRRWDNHELLTLHRVHGRDFEVVRMSEVEEGD
jgi:hypothetical protein